MVDEKNLEDLEFFLSQSLKGMHLLFDHSAIRDILKTPTEDTEFFNMENMEQVQGLIVELMKKESLERKRAYLQSLKPESYEMVVRAYFHIIDNSISTSGSLKH